MTRNIFSWIFIFAFAAGSIGGVMQQILFPLEQSLICVDITDGFFCNGNAILNAGLPCIQVP